MDPQGALAAVPRARFIPDLIYVPAPDTGWLLPLHRRDDPDAWQDHVSGDGPVVTRVAWDPRVPDELRDPDTGRGHVSTSSSSAPYIMARMIDTLDLRAGVRVLEIGTGTGYNAAVIAHITGPDTVTSIERDPEVAARAHAALEGYGVRVVVGDGMRGVPEGAPYDRLIATAAVSTLPPAWEEQVRPGGRIVLPWADGTLGIIDVGAETTMRTHGEAHFMPLRPGAD